MRKLVALTVPFLCLAAAAVAQPMSGFNDSQTGHAVDAQRLSGLKNPNSQAHDQTMAGAGPYSAPATGPLTTATSPTDTAPNAAMTPGSGPYGGTTKGMTPDSGGGAPPAPR